MKVKRRLLACKNWILLKLCFIGYGIAALLGIIGEYEMNVNSVVALIVMLVEMAIVSHYMRNITIVIQSQERDLDIIVAMQDIEE